MNTKTDSNFERRRLLLALVFPLLFVILFWIIKLMEVSLEISLASYGMRPRDLSQWFGVITMPFLHSGFKHLMANTSSFLILGTILFYFYNKYSLQILGWSWLLTGLLTWILGRENSVHIGASGLVYAFAGFIFFSGVLSKNIRLMAISLIVVFMYGSMIWGVFPQNTNISWEGHLAGFITGIVLAFLYHPKDKKPDDEEYEYDECRNCTGNDEIEIFYEYKEKEDNKDSANQK